MEFDDFLLEETDFPKAEQFKQILDRCIASAGDDENVKAFFEQARAVMNRPIRVLRISDYNTTGLIGAETWCKGDSLV